MCAWVVATAYIIFRRKKHGLHHAKFEVLLAKGNGSLRLSCLTQHKSISGSFSKKIPCFDVFLTQMAGAGNPILLNGKIKENM